MVSRGNPRQASSQTSILAVTLQAILALALYTDGAGGECTTITTYNTGLLTRLTGYEERKKQTAGVLLGENADVLCLQEVWFERDVHSLVSSLEPTYPYHYSELHKAVSQGPPSTWRWLSDSACSASDSFTFYTQVFPCGLYNGCLGAFNENFMAGLACATSSCPNQFRRLRPQCISCLTLTATSITSLLSACDTEWRAHDNRLNDAGLLLFSKKPLTDVKYKDYFPGKRAVLPRGYIQAKVDGIPFLCTHQSSLFPVYFEYDLNFANYSAQQEEEFRRASSVFSDDPNHFITGDMNNGPEQPTGTGERELVGEGPELYQLMLSRGYRSPYMEQDGRCTFCSGNQLTSNYDNVAIDHFLVTTANTAQITSQRVLDAAPNGMPLSDHYGVRTNICPAS